jgi:acylphosphatase
MNQKGGTVSADKSDTQAHLIISGRVQGVSFRYYTVQMAQRHKVTGWVRNRADGTVEAVIEGPEAAVEAMIAWCRHGPHAAVVDAVAVEWSEASGDFSAFNMRF